MRRTSHGSVCAFALRLLLTGSTFAACVASNAIHAQETPEVWQASGIALGALATGLPPSIAGIIMPEVVAWPDGTYRMYFNGVRADGGSDVWYADSPDAKTFTVRGVVLTGAGDPCSPEFGVGGASLVHLADGRWRMYYGGAQSGWPNPPPMGCTAIRPAFYSAISADGLTFTREGVRISDSLHTRVRQVDSGVYVAIQSGGAAPPTSRTSADGLAFDAPQILPAPAGSHDPYWAKVGGKYVLYLDTSPLGTNMPSALVLTSLDGLNWSATSTARFEDANGAMLPVGDTTPAGPAIADIGGVVLGDGILRLYSDWNGPNFLSYRRIDGQPPIAPTNYEGLWWNAPAGSESGWGINFAHQGNVIFATWFTYNFAGARWWLSMIANEVADNLYTGTLYQTNGPAYNAVPFDPAQVTGMALGLGTLYFSDANNGIFTYQTGGFTQAKHITREVFGPLPVCAAATASLSAATNYQDLWWAAPAGVESGWGINLTHQGDTIFATWFTYDINSMPLWLVVTAGKTAPGVYSGTLYSTTGPPFNAVPFDPANVIATPVGAATFIFSDGNNATFDYTVNDISQSKAITREVFRVPGTVCQ